MIVFFQSVTVSINLLWSHPCYLENIFGNWVSLIERTSLKILVPQKTVVISQVVEHWMMVLQVLSSFPFIFPQNVEFEKHIVG